MATMATLSGNVPVHPVLSPAIRSVLVGHSLTGSIYFEVPHIDYEKLADDRLGEKSNSVQARVEAARSRQQERFQGTKLACNAEMTPAEVREFCRVE